MGPSGPEATFSYEMLSGGLVWSHETKYLASHWPANWTYAVHPLWNHRSCILIAGRTPAEGGVDCTEMWSLARTLCPNWIGFRLERCEPSEELIRALERGERRLDVCLRRMERSEEA